MSTSEPIIYFSVVGPGNIPLANFHDEHAAYTFKKRVVTARLAQLERIKDRLTGGEYIGEKNFRSNGIRVDRLTIEFMSVRDALDIPDDRLVDGKFLIPG